MEKLLKRLEIFTENLMKDVELDKQRADNYYTREVILNRLYNFIDFEIEKMEHYGVELLVENFEYLRDDIKQNKIENIGDIIDAIFYYVRMDGTLTFSTFRAEKELLANYRLDEILEKMEEYPKASTEMLHIILAEEQFYNYILDEYEKLEDLPYFEKLDEKEKLLLLLYEISKNNGLYLSDANVEYKKLLEKSRG